MKQETNVLARTHAVQTAGPAKEKTKQYKEIYKPAVVDTTRRGTK